MATTQQDLISRIAARFGQYASGTATGGSPVGLVDQNYLIEPDSFWVGSYIKFLNGIAMGLERLVSAYTQASGLTFSPALPYNVGNGTQYELKGVRDADVIRAITDAVTRAGSSWMAIKVDESISFNVNQQIYDLPDDLVTLIAVDIYTAQPTDGIGAWRPFTTYEVLGPMGARQLSLRGWSVIPNNPALTYQMRLQYLALPTIPRLSTEITGLADVDERAAVDFVMEYALHLLHETAFARNPTGEQARQNLTASHDHLAKAQQAEARRTNRYGVGRATRMARPRQIG